MEDVVKRKIILVLPILFLLLPFSSSAFSGSEVHITKDGRATFTSIKIMQIAGTTLFGRIYWGDTYVRMTIKTLESTKILRDTGEKTSVKEFSMGDYIDAEGQLESGSEAIMLLATKVRNTSLLRGQTTVSGKVKTISVPDNKISVDTPQYGVITVNLNGASVNRGTRNIGITSIRSGDKITSAGGDYDYKTKILSANKVTVYANMMLFQPQVHMGTLKAINGVTLPTTLQFGLGGIEYLVNVPPNAEILNILRNKTSLSRFEIGDTVRIYGTIRESDEPIIDAEILRNISL